MISAIPGSRALGAGFLYMAPPSATRRAIAARSRRRWGSQRPRTAQPYATVRDAAFERDVEQQVFQQEVYDEEIQVVSDYMGELAGRSPDDGEDAEAHAWGDTSGNPILREIRSLRHMMFRKYEAHELPPTVDFVGWLMEAVRVGDPWRAYMLLMDVAWENDLIRLYEMPPTQLGELFECLDPLRVHERVDVLANLRFSPAMRGYGFADHLVDKYGVRRIYGTILDVLGPIIEDRVRAGKLITPPAVFSTLFRLAGAASMPRHAYTIRDLAGDASELWTDKRLDAFTSGDIMLDYLRTMFLTESVYYQHDKTRVRLRPRNIPHEVSKLRYQQRHRLEALNMHVRQNQAHSFGMDPDDEFRDLQRWVGVHKRMAMSMPVSRLLVCGPSEDIACAALVASAASGTSDVIRRLLFMFWGVRVTQSGVKDGEDIHPSSPMRPTAKVLRAVARALGGSNEIRISLQVISHMSSHFRIPVPPEVWSELLEFAHVHGAHPASQEWAYVDDPRRVDTKEEIPAIMDVLRKKHGFVPGFRDHVVLATNLIGAHRLRDALEPLRQAKALFEELAVRTETAAVAAAAAQAQRVAMPSYVSRDMAFRHLAMEREVKRHELTTACREWLNRASQLSRYKQDQGNRLFEEMIPDFVGEFFDVLPQRILYDTPTGTILFHHPVQRVLLRKKWVTAPDVEREEASRVLLDDHDDVEGYHEYYGVKEDERDIEDESDWEQEEAEASSGERVDAMMSAADVDPQSNGEMEDTSARITGTDTQEARGERSAEDPAPDDDTQTNSDLDDVISRITGTDAREARDNRSTEDTPMDRDAQANEDMDDVIARITGTDAREARDETSAEGAAMGKDARANEDVDDVVARITGTGPHQARDGMSAQDTAAAATGSAGAESARAPEQTGDQTYVDRLVARRAGVDAADMDRLLAQNMGGYRSGDLGADAEGRRDDPSTASRSAERHLTDEERAEEAYQEAMNEGRGKEWEWDSENVVVRTKVQVNVRKPVPRPQLGPDMWEKWEMDVGAVFVWDGVVRFEAPGDVPEEEEEPEPIEESEEWVEFEKGAREGEDGIIDSTDVSDGFRSS